MALPGRSRREAVHDPLSALPRSPERWAKGPRGPDFKGSLPRTNATACPQFDELLATLKTALATPGTSLLPLLTTMSRFTRYSLANQLLIFAQRPTATHVLGYRSRLKAGFQVRKGEHGIAIYAPMRFTHTSDLNTPPRPSIHAADAVADASSPAVSTQGQRRASSRGGAPCVPAEGAPPTGAAPRVGFRVAWVFDLAQVDPFPGTETSAFATHFADSRDAELAIHRLHAFLFGHNVELEYRHLTPGLMGYTNGRRITCSLGQPAPISSTAKRKPRRSRISSARSSGSPAPTRRSSTSRATAALPTRSMSRSSASAPRPRGSWQSCTRSCSILHRPWYRVKIDTSYRMPYPRRRMRVALDTSVLVAGLRSRLGASNRLLELVASGRCVPLVTTAVFLEYEDVLLRPEHRIVTDMSEDDVADFLAALASAAEPVEVHFQWRPQLPDPADELILEAAVNGRADAIVTHNVRDFHAAVKAFGIPVLTPAKVIQELRR
jgi:putative PIN family toxin of toxin-antitoxin system